MSPITFTNYTRPLSAPHTCHPWLEFFTLSSFSFPDNRGSFIVRVKFNLDYFRVNYTIVLLCILLLSLLLHPVAMIVFALVFIAWFFLYFRCGSPVVSFSLEIGYRIVLGVLGVITTVTLVLTGVVLNVLVALTVGIVVVGVHAASRGTEDLFLDEESGAEAQLLSFRDVPRDYTSLSWWFLVFVEVAFGSGNRIQFGRWAT